MTFIYVIGVISGSLFHSVATPCTSLVGASGGIFALLGAATIKIKRHNKYQGEHRRMFNLLLSGATFVLAATDLGFSIYAWWTCDKSVAKTAISAHVGGFVAGLAVGYIVLNKYQESWGQNKMRKNGKYTDIQAEEVKCCNIANFCEAYICNADIRNLFKGQLRVKLTFSLG